MTKKLYRSIASASQLSIWGRLKLVRLPSPIIYLISVVATKAVSLITLPIMAAHLSPSDYGDYDVVVSFLEFIALSLGLAIAATLIRFASTASDEKDARQCARELVGTSLCIVIIFGIPTVIFGPYLMDTLGINTHHNALRLIIAGATVSAVIELPLCWLRLKDRAGLYFLVVMVRTIAQAVLMWIVLSAGYGIAGLMVVNGLTLLSIAALLLTLQIRDTGIAISLKSLRQIIVYGLPIVGAELAMFGLGNSNRLFMPAHVPSEVIAHFGLAMRIALITSLATAPFELWWMPKRISTLTEPGGLELGARMWGVGFAIILLAGTSLALCGPLIVQVLLPPTYAGTIAFIIPLLVIQCMHITTLLTNVGSYARQNGAYVFGIESFSAFIAITGYVIFIPIYGAYGALLAMAVGQIVRFCLHLWLGNAMAPLPYPWLGAIVSLATAAAMVSMAPSHDWFVGRFLYTFVSLGVLALVIVAIGLVQIPEAIKKRSFDLLRKQ